jgi:hypothetical protein
MTQKSAHQYEYECSSISLAAVAVLSQARPFVLLGRYSLCPLIAFLEAVLLVENRERIMKKAAFYSSCRFLTAQEEIPAEVYGPACSETRTFSAVLTKAHPPFPILFQFNLVHIFCPEASF